MYGTDRQTKTDRQTMLSKQSKQDPAIKERDFRDSWKKRLGILLQKCNSQVILKKMKRLTMKRMEKNLEITNFAFIRLIIYIVVVCFSVI